ncbi:MAG TPA: ice-binding family protein [Nocardioidaceae bacterium]|nr:ice-binding family protein [Nocardioidaceae bacterium]
MSVGVASVAVVGLLVALPGSAQAAATPIDLGTAEPFAVLAGQTITNTGTTTITGDIGISPGSSLTGGPPLMILNGTSHVADTVALGAQAALGNAFDTAAGQTPATAIPSELGGSTLAPGIYSSGVFTITNTVTLDAGNNRDAIFVFQSAATLIAASGSHVALINGAQPCNVFWLVRSSATLNTTADFKGNILALTDISLFTRATVDGRLLARNGAVTLDANTITRSTCQVSPTPTPTTTATATPLPTATATPLPTVISPSPQVTAIPSGPVSTGDGSTSGGGNGGLGLLAGVLVFAGVGGATVVAVRRRRLNV